MTKNTIKDPYGFIYITTDWTNGMKYIGQRKFITGWKSYLGSGKWFSNALKSHKKENFSKEIIAIAYDADELNKLEIQYIKLHDAVSSDDYYNIAFGGEGGITWGLGKNPFYGKTHTDEVKQILSEVNKGKKLSEETKLKMSKSRTGECNYKYIRRTEEMLSDAQTMKCKDFTTKYNVSRGLFYNIRKEVIL